MRNICINELNAVVGGDDDGGLDSCDAVGAAAGTVTAAAVGYFGAPLSAAGGTLLSLGTVTVSNAVTSICNDAATPFTGSTSQTTGLTPLPIWIMQRLPWMSGDTI